MLTPRGEASILCQQGPNRCTEGICSHEFELPAVDWSMEKIHHFLYASHFILETNQNPLEAILTKGINQVTPRLQRILIRIFPYQFTVQYIPGLTNQLADCFSQLGGQKDTIKLHKLHAYHITNQLCARSDSLQQIRFVTQEDDELALLKHTSHKVCQAQLKKFPVFYSLIGHFGRS